MDASAAPALRTAPTTWGPNTLELVGLGMSSLVFKLGDDRVLKRPKTYPEEGNPNTAYTNETNIDALKNEANVYRRLGYHEGILQCYHITDYSIELAFANQGDLMKYMERNAKPAEKVRVDWIRRLADVFTYAHSRRVVVDDIHTANILIHNNCPKLSDFNQSFLLPLETDMEHFSANDTNAGIEVLHLGCIFYSIAVWLKFKYDYFDQNRWPDPEELPNTDGILGGKIIRKCWTRGSASMESLRKDVEASLR
ncbi:serine/threonine protein kinase [Helicocarpus griseus UAMH5409]|uniref:Serine/threonine protein kinase n=1 Tax=Helicocarpus griseus UAMH5409 TaxID=1447875 RepID=A0A2B7WL09_9EURO|nr:serine/threonine protein kinase [Helicocarpus griseus UAMH5409]